MEQLLILHTNDIHGRIEGLARVATLVKEAREDNPRTPVLYFDGGDSEEAAVRLSNLTKGVAMSRLLSAAGCDAVAMGNGAAQRYGPETLTKQAKAANYPILLANLLGADGKHLPGTQPTAIISVGRFRLGLIGVTATDGLSYDEFYKLQPTPVEPLVRLLANDLRKQGVDAVILLSHLGLPADLELAAQAPELTMIIGAHTHDLLPEGEWVNGVLVAQAGQYAENLGWITLDWDGERLTPVEVSVLPVNEDVEPDPTVLEAATTIEVELEQFLDETIGELTAALDFSTERECGVANLMADALRERMNAEVGLVLAGQAFSGPLPGGPLKRGVLWDVCSTTANPGLVSMSGEQLLALVSRGENADFATQRPRPLRGVERGLIHLSGASWRDRRLQIGDQPVDLTRLYSVAGSDYELEPYGGYVEENWKLKPVYDTPIILREALEDYLLRHKPVFVTGSRLS